MSTMPGQILNHCLLKFLDIVAPVKEIRLKQRTQPWITSDIIDDIRSRDTNLLLFRKTGDS